MAGGNPVFDRLNKHIEKERYAGFGAPQRGADAAATGAAGTGAMTQRQLEDLYVAPAAGPVDMGRVTLEDVIMKSLGLFAILLVTGTASWLMVDSAPALTTPFWLGGMFLGLALGLAIAFMKRVSVPLIVLYAAVEGVFLGAFSNAINSIPKYQGVPLMAVLATVSTFIAMYAGYATGLIKVTGRMRRMFTFMVGGYMIFLLLQLVLQMTGVLGGWGFGGSGGLGIVLSLLGTGLAAWSLAFDFDSIDHAVAVGAPQKYSWLLAHGLIVSVVWLYIEFVRLFARMRD